MKVTVLEAMLLEQKFHHFITSCFQTEHFQKITLSCYINSKLMEALQSNYICVSN